MSRILVGLVATLSLTAAAQLAAPTSDGSAQPEALPDSVAPRQAQALVAATTGENAVAIKATGKAAELINAALPFSAAPMQAAISFMIDGSPEDRRRAALCLTQAVYYEAGYEPLEGRRAVAQVVLNRLRHPAFPKSVCGVVYQGSTTSVCQFSFVCDGALYRRPSPAAWDESRAVAEAALAGFVEPAVGSATHYHADYVAPRWAPLLAKVAKLGTHIFYRWPGAWGTRAAFTGRYVGEPNDPAMLRPALRDAVIGRTLPGTTEPGPLAAGPPIARAPNDVGGLLDTSRGWTLNIPGPSDSDGAAARIAEAQSSQVSTPTTKTSTTVASAAVALVAGR